MSIFTVIFGTISEWFLFSLSLYGLAKKLGWSEKW